MNNLKSTVTVKKRKLRVIREHMAGTPNRRNLQRNRLKLRPAEETQVNQRREKERIQTKEQSAKARKQERGCTFEGTKEFQDISPGYKKVQVIRDKVGQECQAKLLKCLISYGSNFKFYLKDNQKPMKEFKLESHMIRQDSPDREITTSTVILNSDYILQSPKKLLKTSASTDCCFGIGPRLSAFKVSKVIQSAVTGSRSNLVNGLVRSMIQSHGNIPDKVMVVWKNWGQWTA